MTPEQQKALALARARRRRAEAQGQPAPAPQERGFGAMLYDNLIGNPDDGVTSFGEGLGSWLNRAGESMTLGLVGDEASAAATGMLPGRSYESELQRYRQNEEDLGFAGRLSADLAGGVIPALAGVGALGSAATLPGRIGLGAGLGAGAGATQGFMEGEGGFGNRLQSGALGGVLGGVLGGAIPVAAEVGRSAVGAARGAMRNRAIGADVGGALGVSPETGRVAAALLGADDQAAMLEALNRAGPNAMLADASGRTVGALDTVLQSPVPGADVARQRVNERAGQSYSAIMDALVPNRESQMSPRAAMEAIRTGTAGARGSAYDAAYAQPINYASEEGAHLLGLQSRLPSKAITYANELMKLKGEQSAQIMASIGEDGAVTFSRPPDVRQWDYIKQALDQLAESGEGAGALGGQTRLGSAYQGLASDVRRTLGRAVPEYDAAVNTAADAITRRQAVEFGSEILNTRVTTDEALERIANATEPQVEAMREGLRGQLVEVFGNINAVPSDRNIDARQAAAALRKFTSPNAQSKLGALFGDEWPAIQRQIEEASSALGLRADVSTNSRTAGRQFTREAIMQEVTPGPLQQGRVVQAGRDLIGGMTGASPEAIARSGQRVQSEMAELLTRQGGTPQQAIDAVTRALAANPAQLAAGGNTALGVALGGYGAAPALIAELMRGMRQ